MQLRVTFVISILLYVRPALGGVCAAGDAPSGFVTAACDGGGADDVCEQDGSQLVCDAARNGDSYGATVFVARYGSAHPFSAWGVDGTGSDFCCVFDDDPEVMMLIVFGTPHNDELRLHKQVGTYSLEDPVGGVEPLNALVNGFGGDDDIQGSYWQTYPTYSLFVTLFGDDDDDDILLPRGKGISSSAVLGEAGDDVIVGSTEGDKVDGGPGVDWISGGDGGDMIYGDAGDDVICGENGTDVLYGQAGVDKLYGGMSEDWADGGATVGNSCSAEHESNCFYTLSSRPTECP